MAHRSNRSGAGSTPRVTTPKGRPTGRASHVGGGGKMPGGKSAPSGTGGKVPGPRR